MLRVVGWIVICFGLITSGALYGQEASILKLGEPVSGTASASGGDLYQFIALSGTRLQARLSLPGASFLTLYSPEGEELIRTEGDSNIELKATLNDDAIYFIGVIRAQPGAPYSLRVEGSAPAVVRDQTESASIAMPQASTADLAVWGLYARLIGQSRQAVNGYRLHWRWEVPQKVLVEEWVVPATGKVAHTNTLRPGAAPGSLELEASHMGGDRSGQVEEDGSVQYQGAGLFKGAYRVQLSPNGDFEMLSLKVRGGDTTVTGSQRFLVVSD